MPAYHYIALNQEQKELPGVIEAPDEQSARQKLNELHLSVVSLSVLAAESHVAASSKDKPVFEFEALDKNGKKITGTIVADSALKAYVRLFDEYKLDVLALFIAILSPREKEVARKLGIVNLQREYEKLFSQKKRTAEKEDELVAQQQAQRRELLDKVDFTTERINVFLNQYSGDLKTEEREIIQAYINQLIRIKDSTNLEHIQNTCKKMLDHIQKQELFLHEELKEQESAKLKIETAAMLQQLKMTGLQQEIDIVKTATKWQENPFLRPIAQLILRIFKSQNPEVQKIRAQIRVLNGNLRTFYKMLIFSRKGIMRMEAWQSIKTLWEEKKRLKMSIRAILAEEEKVRLANSPPNYFWEHVGSAAGWILAFYLLSYIVSYPFTIKNFNITTIKIPMGFYFYKAEFVRGITIFLFLAYSAVTIRNFWLKKNQIATLALYSITVFSFLLIVINLT